MSYFKPDSKVLFIRASAVGDVLNTLPTVEAVRAAYPKAFIAYLVDERSVDIVKGHPAIDHIHFFPRKRWLSMVKKPSQWGLLSKEVKVLFSEIRTQDYDVLVDLHRNLKGGIIGLLSGAKLRVGLAPPLTMEGNQYFTHVQVKPPLEAVHFAEHFLALARHLGANKKAPLFRLPKSPESVRKVKGFRRKNKLTHYAVLHPGTSAYGKLKRWPPDRFAELAVEMGRQLHLKSVIAWGPGEGPLAEGIVRASKGWAVLSFETRSLLELAELIHQADLFVGCDSGPMHLSGVVGTPCVALFGPKDPNIYGVYKHPRYRVVQPPGGMGPTEGITVESVFEAVESVLRKKEK